MTIHQCRENRNTYTTYMNAGRKIDAKVIFNMWNHKRHEQGGEQDELKQNHKGQFWCQKNEQKNKASQS